MVCKLEVQDILLAYRDGNSSLHLSRINKDLGLDLDSWTADSWLVRLEETQVIWYRNVYECISEGNWLSQNKFKWYFLLILSLYNAYKPPWGRSQHWCGAVSYFLYERKKNSNYSVSFDRTDKNKVSFESENGLLLFLYSHNNNETMCFSKILQINEVLCRLGLCHPLFTDM